ncbi:MAG: hypothetical protein H6712_10970 [Myxococcales bacterium]|nr:hypothetical protein [Myxococcales bacterium]
MRGWIGSLGLGVSLVAAGCGDDTTPGILTTFGVPTSDSGGGDTGMGPGGSDGSAGDTEVGTGAAQSTGADDTGPDSTGPVPPECGNERLEEGEECDGSELDGQDCVGLGFDEGALACDPRTCTFDRSECVSWECGDGTIQPPETCEGDELDGNDCTTLGMGFDAGTLACDPSSCTFDVSGCVSWECNNGTLDPGESCDGADLDGNGCTTLGMGFDAGTLACDPVSCAFDTSACTACGDGTAQGAELCDGADLDGETCVTQGYDYGTLACAAGCGAFDPAGCNDYSCGDGMITPAVGEQCDGADLGGQSCTTIGVGYDGGTLACDPTTCSFDTSGCSICGNNVIEAAEACDFLNLGGETCIAQGFDAGTLACAPGCGGFDTSGCITWSCGDGLVTLGEVCDGANLDGESCITQGFDGGTLACSPGCVAFDTSGCFDCGDGVLNGFEQCDGADLDGETCITQGYTGGTLLCAPNCTFNTTSCSSCGNGLVDGPEVCDGANLAGQTCGTQGFPAGGTLACSGDCASFDTSACLTDSGDCCIANGSPGCNEAGCEAAMCAADPYCCDTLWDGICAGNAPLVCGICAGDGCTHDLCTTGGTLSLGCDACVDTICFYDSYCCDTAWDIFCVDEVETFCGLSPCP